MSQQLFDVQTIGAQLSVNAATWPQQEALVFPEYALRLTWSQLELQVTDVARGLLALDLAPGARLALWGVNSPEWVLTFLAAARIGVVTVALDTGLQAAEFCRQMQCCRAPVLLMGRGVKGDEYVEALSTVCSDLPDLQTTVVFTPGATDDQLLPFAELIQRGHSVTDATLAAIADSVRVDDVVNIQYTSAALGEPKGVLLTHRQILLNGTLAGQNLRFSAADRLCIPLPFFHAFGCSLGILLCLAHGATMVALTRFTPEGVLGAIDAEGCTSVHGVPTMFVAMLDSADFSRYDLSSLRTGIMAGAPCPIEVMQQVVERMHARDMSIAYGQTEAGPLITQTPLDDPLERRVSTVGVPLPGVEVRIVDPVSGADCADLISGELWARGPMIMSGYDGLKDESAPSPDNDGWLHTGDLAQRDAAGYYRITGRLRNMIIRGGQNVYPAEVENALRELHGVEQVRVYGLPDRLYGEIVVAQIVCRSGVSLSDVELTSALRGRLAPYKIPVQFEFVDKL